jgi:hypothetical protein
MALVTFFFFPLFFHCLYIDINYFFKRLEQTWRCFGLFWPFPRLHFYALNIKPIKIVHIFTGCSVQNRLEQVSSLSF